MARRIRAVFLVLIICCCFADLSSGDVDANAIPSSTFQESYAKLYGEPLLQNGVVQLSLDNSSGSGFRSIHNYLHGFFSAKIKLPPNYSAGVVTAFYASNYDKFPGIHDELDFEFLGVVPGMSHVLQTNIYGDGSVHIGREERINLWFDPTVDFHKYSILWNAHHIVFFVDDVPIRQMVRNQALGKQYPSKPMGIYSTIWDGSSWATNGGRSPVDYNYGPFVASFTDFKLQGCELDEGSNCSAQAIMPMAIPGSDSLTESQKQQLAWVRANQMFYSYCKDTRRYPTPPPECAAATPNSKNQHKSRKFKLTYDEGLQFQSLPTAVSNLQT